MKHPVTITFTAAVYALKDWLILPVPKDDSAKLPSRGQLSVRAVVNGHQFETVLEPDGRFAHWMRINEALQHVANIKAGDAVEVMLTTLSTWPEPDIPEELQVALDNAPGAVQTKWANITPMARWEWVRWVNATLSQETRTVRVEKTISKLAGKHRRPCCFNLAACTEPYVMKNAQLIVPDESLHKK